VLVQGPGQPYTPGPGTRDAKYEEENTFSDLISLRFPLLNALVLNFGYHNVHHRSPMTPWYKLPALHAKTYGPLVASERVLPMRHLGVSWVRHRVKRVLDSKEAFEAMLKKSGPERAAAFVGDLGVSFLTM
jgi:fatty acid desaturase